MLIETEIVHSIGVEANCGTKNCGYVTHSDWPSQG